MEIKGKVHCFFEQSGTFKNAFIQLGIRAEDYDIQNNFGETDHTDDLFQAIEDAYDGRPSLFDAITPDDLIMAFFPCIYFCENNKLYFRGEHNTMAKIDNCKKCERIIQREFKRCDFYVRLLKLCHECEIRNLRMIIENPYHPEHYLVNNFPYRATIIDHDRTQRGDFFRKPTQFIYVNCSRTYGSTIQKTPRNAVRTVCHAKSGRNGLCSMERSMISPDYARNFICDFILGKEQPEIDRQPTLPFGEGWK